MFQIMAIVLDENRIELTVRSNADVHTFPTPVTFDSRTLRYRDIIEFGVAIGGTPYETALPWYNGRANNSVGDIYRPWGGDETTAPDPLFDLVKANLGLFVHFMSWRLARSMMFRTPAKRDVMEVAASTAAFSSGSGKQNIDWLFDVTTERGAKLQLEQSDGTFKSIMLRLPDEMVGKACETYVPSNTMARTYLSSVGSMRQFIGNMTERYRNEVSKAETNGFTSAANVLEAILGVPGWELRGGRIYYTRRIEPDHVVYHGRFLKLPDEYIGKFYIDEFSIKAAPIIHSVRARGFCPHIAGGISSEEHDLCVGGLLGRSISKAVEIPDMLKSINYHSMFGGRPARMIEHLFRLGFESEFEGEFPGLQESLLAAFHRGEGVGEVFTRND